MFKQFVIMLLLVGLIAGSTASLFGDESGRDIINDGFDDVKQELLLEQKDGNIVNAILLALFYVSEVFVVFGMELGSFFALNVFVVFFLVLAWLFWYPVAWLLCLIGILIKDKLIKK